MPITATYELVCHDPNTGNELTRSTVAMIHRIREGEDIAGYRVIRIRPESTHDVWHVDVIKTNNGDYVPLKVDDEDDPER